MAIGVASALGIARFEETEPIELWPHSSESDREIVIQAVYRQVLGNAYVMESERLTVPESQLKNGEIGVREFIRQVAYSDLYRSRFFENCPRYRAIELNFKHLLGRAPVSYEEMQYHSGLLDNHGYNAEIDAILDSEEYQRMFGSTIVPYYRGYKTEAGQPAIAFSHTFKLMRGASSSDKSNYRSGQAPQLNSHVIRHQPAFVATHAAGFTQQRPRGFLDTALGGQLAYSQEGSGYNATDTFSRLGTGYFEDTGAIEIRPGSTAEDYETAIQAVYRQVLGNAYVMESERLTVAESQFKRGEFSVRDFVRAVGKSDLYRSRFFESCPRYRAFELNFKHFLGRSPDGFEEMKLHSAILDTGTFEDEIDSYLDSDEYIEAYGEDTVPFYRGYKTQTGKKMVGFTHMFQLLRGSSSSDFKGSLAGRKPALNELVIQETPAAIVPPSRSSEGWAFQDPNRGARTVHGVAASTDGKVYRIEITGYRSNKLQRVSKFRRSNQVLLVPFDRLSEEYKRIAKSGGIISSITAV